MSTEYDEELDEVVMGNGETLRERVEALEDVDFDELETSSIDEARERLGL